jgi:hypothetical protein
LKVKAAASTLTPLGADVVTLPIGAVISDADALHGVIMVIDMDMDMDMAATGGAVTFVRGSARSGSAHNREENFLGGTRDISPMRAGADASEPCRI